MAFSDHAAQKQNCLKSDPVLPWGFFRASILLSLTEPQKNCVILWYCMVYR